MGAGTEEGIDDEVGAAETLDGGFKLRIGWKDWIDALCDGLGELKPALFAKLIVLGGDETCDRNAVFEQNSSGDKPIATVVARSAQDGDVALAFEEF